MNATIIITLHLKQARWVQWVCTDHPPDHFSALKNSFLWERILLELAVYWHTAVAVSKKLPCQKDLTCIFRQHFRVNQQPGTFQAPTTPLLPYWKWKSEQYKNSWFTFLTFVSDDQRYTAWKVGFLCITSPSAPKHIWLQPQPSNAHLHRLVVSNVPVPH